MDLSSRINLFKEKKRKKEKKKTNKDKTIANNFRDFVEVGILCTPIQIIHLSHICVCLYIYIYMIKKGKKIKTFMCSQLSQLTEI